MNWIDALTAVLSNGGSTDRFAMLSTVDAGGHPRGRSVVVRTLSTGRAPVLTFSADVRSAKFNELANEDRAELCWFVPTQFTQYRLAGRARISVDAALRQRIWDATPSNTRGQLLGGVPGTPANTPFEPSGRASDASPPPNFVIVELEVEAVDVVDLTVTPTRRTTWSLDAEGWQPLDVHA
jgi:hypothetical protein